MARWMQPFQIKKINKCNGNPRLIAIRHDRPFPRFNHKSLQSLGNKTNYTATTYPTIGWTLCTVPAVLRLAPSCVCVLLFPAVYPIKPPGRFSKQKGTGNAPTLFHCRHTHTGSTHTGRSLGLSLSRPKQKETLKDTVTWGKKGHEEKKLIQDKQASLHTAGSCWPPMAMGFSEHTGQDGLLHVVLVSFCFWSWSESPFEGGEWVGKLNISASTCRRRDRSASQNQYKKQPITPQMVRLYGVGPIHFFHCTWVGAVGLFLACWSNQTSRQSVTDTDIRTADHANSAGAAATAVRCNLKGSSSSEANERVVVEELEIEFSAINLAQSTDSALFGCCWCAENMSFALLFLLLGVKFRP